MTEHEPGGYNSGRSSSQEEEGAMRNLERLLDHFSDTHREAGFYVLLQPADQPRLSVADRADGVEFGPLKSRLRGRRSGGGLDHVGRAQLKESLENPGRFTPRQEYRGGDG